MGIPIPVWRRHFSEQRPWARFHKQSDHCEKVIGSLISRQLTISRSDRIPRTILLRSDHDPGDPARYVDRCWIRNFITTIGHFISDITIVKIHKLPGNIYWNMVCPVSTVCIFSMTLITYIYLSNMVCSNRVVLWANTVCVHWIGHDALVSALIKDVATPPIVTSWIDITSLTFFIQSRPRNFNSNFPVNDSCHDIIGKKLFGFVFSRSDEPIVIGVCGMWSADQDHRIVSEPIASGSFLESGPGPWSAFGRGHQQWNYVDDKVLYFNSDVIKVCCWGYNCQSQWQLKIS